VRLDLNEHEMAVAEKLRHRKAEFKSLRAGQLFGDDSYQRNPADRLHALKKIASDFMPAMVGVLVVSERSDGKYAILDGWGRYYVITELLEGTTLFRTFMCQVYRGLTIAEEALLFRFLNQRRVAIPSHTDWKARVKGGDPLAIVIDAELKKWGYKVGGGKNGIGSVIAVEGVWALGTLDRTLAALRACWSDYKVEGTVFSGLGIFFLTGRSIETESKGRGLYDFLRVTPPSIIAAKMKERFGSVKTVLAPFRYATIIGEGYNHGKKNHANRVNVDLVAKLETEHRSLFTQSTASRGHSAKGSETKTA
jgi:hypothetical protein